MIYVLFIVGLIGVAVGCMFMAIAIDEWYNSFIRKIAKEVAKEINDKG